MWQPLEAVPNVIAAHVVVARVVDANIQYTKWTPELRCSSDPNGALEPTLPVAETFRSHTTCETTLIS